MDQVMTKAQILAGKKLSVRVETPRGVVEIRPLTARELARVDAIRAGGLKIDTNISDLEDQRVSLGMGDMTANEMEAKFLQCSLALSLEGGESWSLDEVAQLDPDFVSAIYAASEKLIGDVASLRPFRKSGKRGSGGGLPGPGGESPAGK